MKRKIGNIAFILFVISCTLCLSSCKEIEKSEQAVNDFFVMVQNGDYKGVFDAVIDENNIMEVNSEMTTEEVAKEKSLWVEIFKKTTYAITASELQDDKKTVAVTADITTIDMAGVLSEATSQAVGEMIDRIFSSQGEMSDQELSDKVNAALSSAVSKPDYKETTNTVTINVVKEKGDWKVVMDEKRNEQKLIF